MNSKIKQGQCWFATDGSFHKTPGLASLRQSKVDIENRLYSDPLMGAKGGPRVGVEDLFCWVAKNRDAIQSVFDALDDVEREQ